MAAQSSDISRRPASAASTRILHPMLAVVLHHRDEEVVWLTSRQAPRASAPNYWRWLGLIELSQTRMDIWVHETRKYADFVSTLQFKYYFAKDLLGNFIAGWKRLSLLLCHINFCLFVIIDHVLFDTESIAFHDFCNLEVTLCCCLILQNSSSDYLNKKNI